jgi:hypothetical protein
VSSLAIHPQQIEARDVVRDIARRTLRSASGISAADRQWLHDIKRDRVAMGNTIRLLELMTAAAIDDALSGPESLRGFVLAHKQPTLPFWSDASLDEQRANHLGDLAQLAWTEHRSMATADGLCETMDRQSLMSRVLADAVRVHISGRRSIHVVSR